MLLHCLNQKYPAQSSVLQEHLTLWGPKDSTVEKLLLPHSKKRQTVLENSWQTHGISQDMLLA